MNMDEHSGHRLKREIARQLEPHWDDIASVSMQLREIGTWHGFTEGGFILGDPPILYGFRSGDGQLIAAELTETDPERLTFEPCDEDRWRRLAGYDTPMPRPGGAAA